MKEKADISLYNAFQVLLDDKYVSVPKDDPFEEAVESATLAVQALQKSAREKEADAKAMVGLLQAVSKLYLQAIQNVITVSPVTSANISPA
jgi:hypothetical protein